MLGKAIAIPKGAMIGPNESESVKAAMDQAEKLKELRSELGPEELDRRSKEFSSKKKRAVEIVGQIQDLLSEIEALGYDASLKISYRGDQRVNHHAVNLQFTASIIDPDMAPRDDLGKHIHSLDFAEGSALGR